MGQSPWLERSYGVAFLCSLALHGLFITSQDSAGFTPGGGEGLRVNILLVSQPSAVLAPETSSQNAATAAEKLHDLGENRVEALESAMAQDPPEGSAVLSTVSPGDGRTVHAKVNHGIEDSTLSNSERQVEIRTIEAEEDQMPIWLREEEKSQVLLEAGLVQSSTERGSVPLSKVKKKRTQGLESSVRTRNFVPARFLDLSQPPYPFSEKNRGHEGSVVLEVSIDSGGTTQEVKIIRSSGYLKLDQVSILAIKAARVSPALENGIPVASIKTIRFTFQIR